MQAAPDIFDENSETELSLLSVSENLYQKLCDRIGAAYGSNLLINSYEYNDNGYWKAFGIGLLVLICAIVLITYIELNKLKHQNIIEEIRLDLV